MCILRQINGTDIFYDMSEQDIFSWDSSNMHFSLGLPLNLVCETGGLLFLCFLNKSLKLTQKCIYDQKQYES